MGRSGKNFLSLLDNDKVKIFCAFDKDYNPNRAKIYHQNLFSDFLQESKTCVFMDQIHSNIVEDFDENFSNFSCDGLFSTQKELALCVLSADCLPLLLWHEKGVIAALHSGRKGSFENILKVCVEKISKKFPDLERENFHLFIAPGICGQNYALSGEVLKEAKAKFKDFVKEDKLDLKALVKFQAKELGIRKINTLDICTFEDEKFFSYRRNQTPKRFVSGIVLKA